MSWIDRELKRRAAASSRSAPNQSSTNRIHELWDKLERSYVIGRNVNRAYLEIEADSFDEELPDERK